MNLDEQRALEAYEREKTTQRVEGGAPRESLIERDLKTTEATNAAAATREFADDAPGHIRGIHHWSMCWGCALDRAADEIDAQQREIERLRAENESLAEGLRVAAKAAING